ncbi:taperin [Stigmatopora argus]
MAMSGGGELRYARKETGQESPRMPAWKREILERRKAKSGGSGGAAAAENGAGGSPKRSNGEQTINGGNGNGGPTRDRDRDRDRDDAHPSRNYSITPASQHFANNKEAAPGGAEGTARAPFDGQESLVLQESLGPLEENPFIKLEKERRRRQDRENATRPIQHILELYGNVPGIRTIRADNILIIESDPDYVQDGEEVKSPLWQHNGYSSVNDLLERRGTAVTEIRAKEVVIYDTTLSKSEENLSTIGRPNHRDPSYEASEGQGMVSRILQKFDSNYGKLHTKSHSTENLLDLDGSAGRRQRTWAQPQMNLMPKPRSDWVKNLGNKQTPLPLFQSSPRQKPHSPVLETGSPQHAIESSKGVASFRHRFEENRDRVTSVTPRDEPDRAHELTPEMPLNAKAPSSTQSPNVRPESVSPKMPRTSPDFEIRPSPKPDLSQIPDRDTQARALANLRLQSKNSFTVIPKRHLTSSHESNHAAPPSPVKTSPSHRVADPPVSGSTHTSTPNVMLQKLKETKKQEEKEVVRPFKPHPFSSVATSALPLPSQNVSPSPTAVPPPALTSPPSSPSSPTISPRALSPDPSPRSSPGVTPPADHLPVTNIDDIEVEAPHRVAGHSPSASRRKGNTFTVVPKRRGEPEAKPGSPEPQQDASSDASPGAASPQAPYSQLGTLLKKRYPAVEEIEVIGGYLSLGKSCLSKTGSLGKKLKISFNESSLHSTYEYPSESSAWDSGEEADEDKRDGKVAEEAPSMVGRIHIPRPSFTSSPTHTKSSNDLSNYIPKHSMDFSAWQEYKQEDSVNKKAAPSKETQMTEEVMLTPADSSSLSDYSSEPALYF